MKKKLLMGLSLLAVAGLSIGGTVAYFTAQHAEVATFTYGDVAIEQLQYERAVDENGNWISTGTVDQYTYTPDKLVQIRNTQGNPILPAVYQEELKYDDRNGNAGHQQSWGQLNAPGSNQLFDDSMKNVIDRFVFVKNTGNNDAYVRTWIAFEKGSVDDERYNNILHINANRWTEKQNNWWKNVREIENYTIRDSETGKTNNYFVICYEFLGEDATNKANGNQILKPGSITRPSLLQFFLDPTTTSEEVRAMDGNDDKQFNVIVVSQAVQAKGFTNATQAFEQSFGDEIPF